MWQSRVGIEHIIPLCILIVLPRLKHCSPVLNCSTANVHFMSHEDSSVVGSGSNRIRFQPTGTHTLSSPLIVCARFQEDINWWKLCCGSYLFPITRNWVSSMLQVKLYFDLIASFLGFENGCNSNCLYMCRVSTFWPFGGHQNVLYQCLTVGECGIKYNYKWTEN